MTSHATALIHASAKIASDATVGPYCIVEAGAEIGSGTHLHSHVVVHSGTRIGSRCQIHAFAVLGGPPQDKKFKDGNSFLVIGDDNVIREHVTMNRGSAGAKTIIGDGNTFMIGSHVGHDCVVGNEVVMANGTALGGHSVVEDKVVLGGNCGIHQFVRVGKLAMVGAHTKAAMDVPPYSLCDGYPAKLYGLNAVGLKRAGYSSSDRLKLKAVLKDLLSAGSTLASRLIEIEKHHRSDDDVLHLIAFVKGSKRGVMRFESNGSEIDTEIG